MSRHVGVKCDGCQKGNFKGKRFKCLVCYDFDLCAACYDARVTNTTHVADHAMQCILTASDYELYYGGESVVSSDHPYSYACPFCSRMGFTVITLEEHVVAEHNDAASTEVICPVCAAHPGGEPNFSTADFIGHLTLEHNPEFRDLISFLDEPATMRANSQRPTPLTSSNSRRGCGSTRSRRSNMHFSTVSSVPRDSVDPIAELLTQLSGVRRSTTNTTLSSHFNGHLEHLQQLQLEREHYNAVRQQMETRFSRRKAASHTGSVHPEYTNYSLLHTEMLLNANPSTPMPITPPPAAPKISKKFLLDKVFKQAEPLKPKEIEVRDSRSTFVKQLILSTLKKRPEQLQSDSSKSITESQVNLLDGNLNPIAEVETTSCSEFNLENVSQIISDTKVSPLTSQSSLSRPRGRARLNKQQEQIKQLKNS